MGDVKRKWCSSLLHYYNIYHYYHKLTSGSMLLSGTEVSVRVMFVCIWSQCAWPVVDWMKAVGLCPVWCSVTAGMGWSSLTWQHATTSFYVRSYCTELYVYTCASVHESTKYAKGAGAHSWWPWLPAKRQHVNSVIMRQYASIMMTLFNCRCTEEDEGPDRV